MESQLLLANVPGGVVIRVAGRGTMRDSSAFRTAADMALERGPLVVDMSECEYLDSTFLGCLVGIRKQAEQQGRAFDIFANSPQQAKLFSTSSLDKYFEFVESCPPTISEWVVIEPENLDVETLSRHVLVCHQRLAERGGKDSEAFERVVERLTWELGE